jgi:hypothetical protein
MNKMQFVVISTGLLMATGGALAQDAAKRTEEIRNSSEAMKPPTDTPARTMQAPAAPLSEADRKAEEARRSSEQMKPQTNATGTTGAGGNTMAAPLSPADQKAAAEQQKSEMMKPK